MKNSLLAEDSIFARGLRIRLPPWTVQVMLALSGTPIVLFKKLCLFLNPFRGSLEELISLMSIAKYIRKDSNKIRIAPNTSKLNPFRTRITSQFATPALPTKNLKTKPSLCPI